MSKFTDFYTHVTTDEKAKAHLEALAAKFTGDAEMDSVVDDLIVFAKEEGFDFTKEEVKEYFAAAEAGGELSEDELEAVAGGKATGGCFLVGKDPGGGYCFAVGSAYGGKDKGACIIIGAYHD